MEPGTQNPGTTANNSDEGSTESCSHQGAVKQRQRAVRAIDAEDEGEHAVVTKVEVTKQYKFPHAGLSAMADNMGTPWAWCVLSLIHI